MTEPVTLTLYVTVQEIPPAHRRGYTLRRHELLPTSFPPDRFRVSVQPVLHPPINLSSSGAY